VARAQLAQPDKVALFCQWAETNNATVARVAAPDVPAEIVSFLARSNLPARAAMAPSPQLADYDWASQKMLSLRRGRGEASDQVSITGAFAGIAETGTVVTASGPDHPVTLNLLPDTHIVVIREEDIVSGYEEVWARLRARYGKDRMPRTVNTLTGPSRTGDIEQAMELGAHGPRRMHIVVVRPSSGHT
jgi:L-lactate dehydrogenase complex protein LldG